MPTLQTFGYPRLSYTILRSYYLLIILMIKCIFTIEFQGISVACLALAVILNQMCYNPDVINQWTVGPPQDITTASNITKVGSDQIHSLANVSHLKQTALKD